MQRLHHLHYTIYNAQTRLTDNDVTSEIRPRIEYLVPSDNILVLV